MVAVLFSDLTEGDLDHVTILPGDSEDKVELRAASSIRAVKVIADGYCARRICVQGKQLRQLFRRHKDAEYCVINESEDGRVSVRLFSQDVTTMQYICWNGGDGLNLPTIQRGDFRPGLRFDSTALYKTISMLGSRVDVEVSSFPIGLVFNTEGEGWKAEAFLAGVMTEQVDVDA